MDLSPIMPRDSHSWRTFEDLQTQFGAGNAMPNTLLVLPPAGTKVDRDFFQRSHASLKKLSELHTVDPSMPKATVTSMMYMSSNPKLEAGTSWLLYDITTNTKNCSHHPQLTKLFHGLCTANLTSFCTTNVTQLCQTYQLLASQFVSPNRDAAMARVVLDSNPLAPPGVRSPPSPPPPPRACPTQSATLPDKAHFRWFLCSRPRTSDCHTNK